MSGSIIGKVIDNYEITGILGKGGMGVVYRAKDLTLDRDVALKMMDSSVARDEEFLKRFKSEAKALARIQSPNIVSVFALRETDLGFCLVMEFVEGGTLSDRIRAQGALPIGRTISIFKQITTALDHAHRAGVLHRDIKPSNIMLTPSDVVKVTDFGLAKIQQVSTATVTMGTGGTLYYMSPEQVRGLANVDARGDIYSIGMTLYEAATGRVPFGNNATDFDIRQMIVQGKIPPPETFGLSLPKEFSGIILRAIQKEPARRYQSCAEMCDALSSVQIPPDADAQRPRVAAQPMLKHESRSSARRPLYVTLLIGAALFASFFVYRQFFSSASSTISLHSTPAGATILSNNAIVGKTPMTLTVNPGSTRLRLEREGYVSKDTSLVLLGGESVQLEILLMKTTTNLTTRNDSMAAAQTKAVADNERIVRPVLNQRSATGIPVPAKVAQLLLRAVPSGSATVDGKTVSLSTNDPVSLEVTAGRKRILFQHGMYGRGDFEVDVRPNEKKTLTCYFEAQANVNVSGDAQWAFIVHNGVTTNEQTPKVLTLEPGRHRISVWKRGHDVLEPERVINVKPSLTPSEHLVAFTLKKK